jgi:hypothetical protein
MQNITESFLQIIAGDIEKLLIENQETIAWAYKKIPDGIKLSMGITLDPSSNGIVVSYDFGFDLEPKPEPPEKHKVKFKHVINEMQADLGLGFPVEIQMVK